MATAQAKHEFTDAELDALLERAVSARERKEWEEKVRKAGGALGDQIAIYQYEGEGPLPGVRDCWEWCVKPGPRLPKSLKELATATCIEVHEGHPVPKGPWRKLTPAEATEVVTLQDQLRLREILQSHGDVQETEAVGCAEISNVDEMIATLERRRVELQAENQKARARTEESKARVDAFFEGKSEEWKRNALMAVHELHSAIVASVPDNRARYSDDHTPIGPPPKMPRPLGAYGGVPASRSVAKREAMQHEEGAVGD
ncbi:MAG TPA: hypothetical protein VGQ75_10410 [Thermoanaerobaculia bacterium]|nr:hypothetical protein [Thermoanaerobaculia bacterium]HEV8608867.1 hypothetical protein [Thermoanaerobaculia bacterium]